MIIDELQLSRPMTSAKFSDETGFTPHELYKRHSEWHPLGVCFKIKGRWFYDYYEFQKWIRQQKTSKERQKTAMKSPFGIKARDAGSGSKQSPQLPMIEQ